MWLYSRTMAFLTLIGLVCLLLGGCLMVNMLPKRQGTDQAEIAIEKLRLLASENERAKAEAEAWPEAIREQGMADERRITASTDAYVRRLLAETQAFLALEKAKARQEWRAYTQLVGLVVAIILAFVIPLRFGERVARWLSR